MSGKPFTDYSTKDPAAKKRYKQELWLLSGSNPVFNLKGANFNMTEWWLS